MDLDQQVPQPGKAPHLRRRLASRDDRHSDEHDDITEILDKFADIEEQGLVDNPLLRLKPDEVDRLARHFAYEHDLVNHEDVFRKAGKILRDPEAWQSVPQLTAEERMVLADEKKMGFWKQPMQLRITIIMLCVAAVVQGWSQVGTNGANLNWPQQMHVKLSNGFDPRGRGTWIFGLVNAAPYLSASLVGCWLSDPLNEYFFGRRAPICVSALVILASAVGGACSQTWPELLICRLILGLGMGAKASVVPVFAAEVSPAHLRGSLVMNWQLFDAFGIFLGTTANLIVAKVGPTAWRWQVASSVLPTIVLLSLIYVVPESPRFLMKRGYYKAAYESLILLRYHPIFAAKELFYVHWQMKVETAFLLGQKHLNQHRNGQLTEQNTSEAEAAEKSRLKLLRRPEKERPINYFQKLYQLFSIPRNRRATVAAVVVMISQQLCGINVLIFFSSTFFRDAGKQQNGNAEDASYLKPLFLSWGLGLTNFLFAFPAYYLIDRKGRRWLLLATLPFMAITILAAGLSFLIRSDAHGPVVAFWTFVFFAFYSPGMGPVPFTLSAEVFPLESRVVGMSFAVFVNLLGAGMLALFVPPVTAAVGHLGLLGIFAGLNVVAFVLIYFLVRETAGAAVDNPVGSLMSISLEELNYLFAVPTKKHAIYQIGTVLPWAWRYYVRRDKSVGDQPEKLYTWASAQERQSEQPPVAD